MYLTYLIVGYFTMINVSNLYMAQIPAFYNMFEKYIVAPSFLLWPVVILFLLFCFFMNFLKESKYGEHNKSIL